MKLALAILMATASSVMAVTPAQATFPGDNGQIAYYDFAMDPSQIFAVEPHGSPVTQLTSAARRSYDPAWSADGSSIVFVRSRKPSANAQLVTMDADGSNLTIVLRGATMRRDRFNDPTFSPDGTQIAFCAQNRFNGRIFLVNVDGTGLTKITQGHHSDCQPTWSPDGSTIAFITAGARGNALATMATDGSDRSRLVSRGVNYYPDWSPDGSHLVFCRIAGPSGRFDVYSIDADGSGRTQLTHSPRRWEWTPSFSPDGTSIAFARSQGRSPVDPSDIFIMAIDGTDVSRVSDTPDVDEYWLSWQAV